MRSSTTTLILSLIIALATAPPSATDQQIAGAPFGQNQSSARQLMAVRGEIVKIKNQGKGMLLITIRPAKEFAEVSVLARENDFVGLAVGRSGDADLFGLLAGDEREDEMITAAELSEGDVVSVIYDSQPQNRALEIYIH
jgi:hypothetical protein